MDFLFQSFPFPVLPLQFGSTNQKDYSSTSDPRIWNYKLLWIWNTITSLIKQIYSEMIAFMSFWLRHSFLVVERTRRVKKNTTEKDKKPIQQHYTLPPTRKIESKTEDQAPQRTNIEGCTFEMFPLFLITIFMSNLQRWGISHTNNQHKAIK